MDNVLKLVILAGSLFMTGVVIFSAVNLTNIGSITSKNLTVYINDKNAAVENAQYTQYENGPCTGSDVVTAIRKYKDTMSFTVNLGDGTVLTDSDFTGGFQNYPSNANYINPSCMFSCILDRSPNGVVIGMTFTEDSSYLATAAASGYVLPEESTASALSDPVLLDSEAGEEAVGDVEVIFSDGSETKKNTEKSISADNIADLFTLYASEMDDIVHNLENFDVETGSEGDLRNVRLSLQNLETKLVNLKEKCKEAGDGEEWQAVVSQTENLLERLKSLQESLSKLEKQMESKVDSSNLWWIGYPVKENVKAVLKDGVLSFIGDGEVSVEGLPGWLEKASEIKSVQWGEVVPVNVDYWFSGCINLTRASLPSSVESANGTFEGCTSLNRVTLGSNVISANGIGANAVFRVPEGSMTQQTFEELSKITDVEVEVF